MSITLFGSLFYSGLIAVGTVVVVFSIYIVEKTSGDTHGIAICFGSFAFCVLCVMLIGYKFNRTSVEQLKAKGNIRSFLQRLQSSAECIAFYASSKTCELLTYFNLNNNVHIWNIRSAIWYALVNFPLAVMGKFLYQLITRIFKRVFVCMNTESQMIVKVFNSVRKQKKS